MNALNIDGNFFSLIYTCACIFYVFAIYQAFKFLLVERLNFMPSFSAFTFPFVISALATKGFLNHIGENIILTDILEIETVLAVLIVTYVLIRYMIFLKNS